MRVLGQLSAATALLLSILWVSPAAQAGPGYLEVVSDKGAIHVRVSVRYDAASDELAEWEAAFEEASKILYEATEGQFYIADVVVCNSCLGGDQADIWLYDTLDRSYVDNWGLGTAIGTPDLRGHFSAVTCLDPARGGAPTVAHEFAHYVLGLYDEYQGFCCSIPPFCQDRYCTDPGGSDSACLLENYKLRPRTELCGPWNHDLYDDPATPICSEAGDTVQHFRHGKSCWETVASLYPFVQQPAAPPVSGQTNPPAMNWEVRAGVVAVILLEQAQGVPPEGLRQQETAAGLIIERLPPTSEVAVLTYNQDGVYQTLVPLMALTGTDAQIRSKRDMLRVVISGRPDEPCAELCEPPRPVTALQDALDIFDQAGQACVRMAFVVGRGNVHPQEPANLFLRQPFQQRGIPVHTLAILSPAVPVTGLERYAGLADITFGKSYAVMPGGDVAATTWALLDDAFAMASPAKGSGTADASAGKPSGVPSESGDSISAVTVEPGLNSAAFLVTWDSSLGTLDFRLKPPTGDAWTCSIKPPGVSCMQGPGYAAFTVPDPEAGEWELQVFRNAAASVPYTFRVSADSPSLHADVWQPGGQSTSWPDPIRIKARAYSGSPVAGLAMTCDITRPDGSSVPVQLYDDGLEEHGDFAEGDGEFSAIYAGNDLDGIYIVEVTADNTAGEGTVFVDVPVTDPQPAGEFVRSTLMTIASYGYRDPVEDVNADGTVNEDDMHLLAQYLGETSGSAAYWRYADVNSDGIVDVLDYARVARKIDTGAPAGPPGSQNPPGASMSLDPSGGAFGTGLRVESTVAAGSVSDLCAWQAVVGIPGDHLMLHSDVVQMGSLFGGADLMNYRVLRDGASVRLWIVGALLDEVEGVSGSGTLAGFSLWTRCAGQETVLLGARLLNSALVDIPVAGASAAFTVTSELDVTPPGPFTIDDGGKYTSFDFGINVKWTGSEEYESGIHTFEYAIGTADDPTAVAAWAPVLPSYHSFFFCDPGKSLQEGVEYFVSMRAINGQCLSSPVAVSDGIRYAPSYSLAQTRSVENGRYATVNATVSARFPDRAWLTDWQRVATLGVETPPDLLAGAFCTAAGVLTTQDGMRILTDSEVRSYYNGASPEPIGITQKAMGGSELNAFLPGVTGGVGLYNIGMLVRTAGRVTSEGTGYFYCDDGSGLTGPSGEQGAKVLLDSAPPAAGSFVAVTGIIETEVSAGIVRPVVRVRTASDIQPH